MSTLRRGLGSGVGERIQAQGLPRREWGRGVRLAGPGLLDTQPQALNPHRSEEKRHLNITSVVGNEYDEYRPYTDFKAGNLVVGLMEGVSSVYIVTENGVVSLRNGATYNGGRYKKLPSGKRVVLTVECGFVVIEVR